MSKIEAVVVVLCVSAVLFLAIGLPFVTGSTFGQRCAKAYPDDPAQQEWCVKRLNKGGSVYPRPAGLEHPYE